jgi:hypothetical protein
MQELITRIASKTGLDPSKAERGVGIMLSLVKTQGNQAKMAEMFAKLPGAEELALKHGGDGAGGGGLLAKLGGGAMGGPLAAVAKLASAGINMDQMKVLGTETLGYAKEKAGDDLVRQVASSIPGVSAYL